MLAGLSGHGARARLSVLVYHRVVSEPDPMRPALPTTEEFRQQMELIARCFRVLPLGEAVDRMYAGALPERALSITFDDGYADNHSLAFPIAHRLGLPMTFFVASGFLDGGRMWNDTVIEFFRRVEDPLEGLAILGIGAALSEAPAPILRRNAAARAIGHLKHLSFPERAARTEQLEARCSFPLPTDLMMTSGQVRSLAHEGMDIGSHTLTHPILKLVDRPTARSQIAQDKTELEKITGKPVDLFAYPNGKSGQDFTARDVALVQELGFKAAVTTEPGVSSRRTPPFELRRFTPWDRTPARFALRLGRNYLTSLPERAGQYASHGTPCRRPAVSTQPALHPGSNEERK
jgi:peptidoglycan/xylan/chitin deacetylase (PgdA/CDA1 family)